MSNVLIILACLIPTALYAGLIYRVDRYEREPIWLLSAVFIWGAIPSIVLAIVANRYLSITLGPLIRSNFTNLTNAAIIAPLVEESVKGLALLIVLFIRRNDIDTLLDGIIYGAMVGMGFAMVENYFYFSSEYARGGLQAFGINVFYRALVFGLNHSLFSSFLGLGVAIARLTGYELVRLLAPIIGWSIGVTLHGIHNATVGLSSQLCIIAPLADYGGILLTVLIIVWALRQEHQWLRDYLKEEVALGTITVSQYEMVSNRALRRSHMWGLFSHLNFVRYQRTRRFLAMLSKLAYQKHHADVHPAQEHTVTVRTMRAKIRAAGDRLL